MTFDGKEDKTENDESEDDETKPFFPINHIVPVVCDDDSNKMMDLQTGLEVITETPTASVHDNNYDKII